MASPQIIPAILARTSKELHEALEKIPSQATTIQIDIMDGTFVDATTVSCNEIPITKQQQEYHLMVDDPLSHIRNISHAQSIIVHIETCQKNVKEVITHIKEKKAQVGLALNPTTSFDAVKEHLAEIDILLLMTVQPGAMGQKFVKQSISKIKEIKEYIVRHKLPTTIEVDGGIGKETVCEVFKAGANRLVVGSAIMKQENPQQAMKELQEQLKFCR